jgi:hypothetical protein
VRTGSTTRNEKAATKESRRPDTNTTPRHQQSHLSEEDSSVEQAAESLRSNSEDEDNDSSDDDDDEDDVEDVTELQEGMDTMSLKAQASVKLPMLMYTWSKDRQELCSIDILLLSGITEENIECKIDRNARYVTADIFLPDFFLSSRRLQAASEGSISQHHSKTASLDKAIDAFREAFDFETPTLKFKIKLPFKVDGNFEMEVMWYRHDNVELAAEEQFYYMLHLELVSANKPRQVKTAIARRIVESPQQEENKDPDL